MRKIKSTLRVFNEKDLKKKVGIVKGQKIKILSGNGKMPSERIRAAIAFFKPGTYEALHWHLIEVFYFVISGRAIMKNIEGKRYNIGPGSVIYAPAGIAGSHDWDIKEELKLIAIRATIDLEKNIQFTVDPGTLESRIDFGYLISRNGGKFDSLY